MNYPLYIGCTWLQHKQIGINAVVNARAGLQHLNDQTLEEIEMIRDARRIQDRAIRNIRMYQVNSKFFRKRINRIKHLISAYDEI